MIYDTSFRHDSGKSFGEWDRMTVKDFEEVVKERAGSDNFRVIKVHGKKVTDENKDKIFITIPSYNKAREQEIETLCGILEKHKKNEKMDLMENTLKILSDYEDESENIRVEVDKNKQEVKVFRNYNYQLVVKADAEVLSSVSWW